MKLPVLLVFSTVTVAARARVVVGRDEAPASMISDPASYVLPFIGTTGGGHAFLGATLPHGMVKAGMDTDSPDNQAGYDANPKYKATGFSQLHDLGTGDRPPLSNFKIWPFAQCSSFEECPTSLTARKLQRKLLPDGRPDDFASPGYFSTSLTNSIRVELTSTRRTALHRYTFPNGTESPRIVVDISNDGQRSGSRVSVTLNPDTAQVRGGATFSGSFGPGSYRAYTCVSFAGQGYTLGKPTEYGIWTNNAPVKGKTHVSEGETRYGEEVGALLTFSPAPAGNETVILVRVGVSFISTKQACDNAESEIPVFDFEKVRGENRAAWNELLGRIQVDPTGVPNETLQLFYSSFYRSHISPADYTDENPLWNSTEPYYDSLYCNWDTFRTLFPLMSLHDPARFADIVRGMIDIQRHEGWLPECRGATLQQWVQGGSNADPILGEFFVKFHEQAGSLHVSANDLYDALIADAEDQPLDWSLQGRQVGPWKTFGYIPHGVFTPGGMNTRQVSRTLEYAFDDFAISQVAKLLGKTDDAQKYSQGAANFLNVWNPNTTVPGSPEIRGMFQPRYENATFGYTDPRHCSVHDPTHSTCFLDGGNNDGFYESSPLVYSQFVPQDTARLIELQGGVESFVKRLDFIFDQNYFDVTNEPSFQMPYMYHYADQPGRTAQRVREVIANNFNISTNGLPGNDDSGAMGSYITLLLSGLYPVPSTRQYLLSAPFFRQVSFVNPVLGTTTTIRATNFTGSSVRDNIYVQDVMVNGHRYHSKCYLDWNVFMAGSLVELILTDNVNISCGSGRDALPPSLSTGGFDSRDFFSQVFSFRERIR